MSSCLICGSSASSGILNLQKIGYRVCCDYNCAETFMKQKGKEMPICIHCTKLDSEKRICPVVEVNPFLKSIGGLNLKFPKFALFCLEFTPEDSFQQQKLVGDESG